MFAVLNLQVPEASNCLGLPRYPDAGKVGASNCKPDPDYREKASRQQAPRYFSKPPAARYRLVRCPKKPSKGEREVESRQRLNDPCTIALIGVTSSIDVVHSSFVIMPF